MFFSRRKVHPPHNHWPRVIEALLLGTLFGVGVVLSQPLAKAYLNSFVLIPLGWLAFSPVLFGFLLRHCRHRCWLFMAGAVGFGSSCAVQDWLHPFHEAEQRTLADMTSVVFAFVMGGVIGGVLVVAFAGLRDLVAGPPILQDGTLCPACGYTIAHLPDAKCPECGVTFSAEQIDARTPCRWVAWRPFISRWSIGAGVLLIIYFSFPYALTWASAKYPGLYLCADKYLALRPECSSKILLNYLETGDERQRLIGAGWLGFVLGGDRPANRAEKRVVDQLAQSAQTDPSGTVRMFAVQSLGILEPVRLYELLPGILQDDDENVRCHGLAALSRYAKILDPKATSYLIEGLDDPSAEVRRYAYRRLMVISRQSFPFTPNGPKWRRMAEQWVWKAWWQSQQQSDRP